MTYVTHHPLDSNLGRPQPLPKRCHLLLADAAIGGTHVKVGVIDVDAEAFSKTKFLAKILKEKKKRERLKSVLFF